MIANPDILDLRDRYLSARKKTVRPGKSAILTSLIKQVLTHLFLIRGIMPLSCCQHSRLNIKGKSAIHIARQYMGRKRDFVGQHFWARGYFVSTVGRDEQVIREYVRHQEKEDRRIDQLQLV